MTRQEATALYCAINSKASKVISQLIRWDETKTIGENAEALGISNSNSVCLAVRYGLAYKRSRKPYRLFSKTRTRNEVSCNVSP